MATRTAEQKRLEAKLECNAYLDSCPSRQVLDTVSDKWVCLVMSALADGPRRYSELSRAIAGVSQKMLTQTLRMLEQDGLVSRAVTASVPVRVDYELTKLGVSLMLVIRELKHWAEDNIDEILDARATYSAKVSS